MGFDITVYKGSKEGGIVKSITPYNGLGPHEILVRITHSGVCGSDEHLKHTDIVLGHEGIGVVQEIGQDVKEFQIGDRAGFGFQHDSCGHCSQCLSGRETFCPERHFYGENEINHGSFATHAVWKESFLFHIPGGIDSAKAAPLMCAGATIFNALHTYGVEPTHRVGIVGVGGLGHAAIMFAAKMGCEVVVFSSTDSKKEEAMRLGAREFVASKGLQKIDIKPVDHLLVTTSAQPDWNLYFPVIASGGTIFPLTVSFDNLTVPYLPLISKGIRIQGVIIPARSVHNQMLHFAEYHDIQPIIQTFPLNLEGIEDAMSKLEQGKIRYRAVLVPQE